MSRYAEDTRVPVDRSRSEIERVLKRYGATAFAYGWQATGSTLAFTVSNRHVRIELPLPDPEATEFSLTEAGRLRSDTAREQAYEQAVRQRWRALVLVIKAKLEAVESGISTVEREFLSDVVLPNGATVGQWARPQIAEVYDRGQMPALLPGVNGGKS